MIHVTNPRQIAIVGRGCLGSALAERLTQIGHHVAGPLAREYAPAALTGVEAVLLCVPDRELEAAATVLARRLHGGGRCPLTGHCSGAGTLEQLDPLPTTRRFSLHPLMTFAGLGEPPWEGAAAAVAARDADTLTWVSRLARELGLAPFAVADADRDAYHAAASIASNFLVTLEVTAERLAGAVGVERAALLPLVRATVENWGAAGAAALTGPIARGDTATVARQREAVAARAPELLDLFEVLSGYTRELACPAGASVTPVAA